MKEYDEIGSEYRSVRSSDVGLSEILDVAKGFDRKISILDLGCGNGYPIAEGLIAYAHRYVGVDSSKVLAKAFQETVHNAEVFVCCMSEIDFGKERFDLIIAFGSLFHLTPEKQKVVLAKAARCLQENGRFVFTSGIEAGECVGEVAGVPIKHWSLDKESYIQLLYGEGLELISCETGSGDNVFYTFAKK